MTLADIAERTRLSRRRLCYTLEHGVLPGGPLSSEGRGNERSFTEWEAFSIACAALMLEGGLRRKLVTQIMNTLVPKNSRRREELNRSLLWRAFAARGDARLQIGDGQNVRLCVTPAGSVDGWQQLGTGAPLADAYEPDWLFELNVGQLRKKLGS